MLAHSPKSFVFSSWNTVDLYDSHEKNSSFQWFSIPPWCVLCSFIFWCRMLMQRRTLAEGMLEIARLYETYATRLPSIDCGWLTRFFRDSCMDYILFFGRPLYFANLSLLIWKSLFLFLYGNRIDRITIFWITYFCANYTFQSHDKRITSVTNIIILRRFMSIVERFLVRGSTSSL